jgi:hypothetical protein
MRTRKYQYAICPECGRRVRASIVDGCTPWATCHVNRATKRQCRGSFIGVKLLDSLAQKGGAA